MVVLWQVQRWPNTGFRPNVGIGSMFGLVIYFLFRKYGGGGEGPWDLIEIKQPRVWDFFFCTPLGCLSSRLRLENKFLQPAAIRSDGLTTEALDLALGADMERVREFKGGRISWIWAGQVPDVSGEDAPRTRRRSCGQGVLSRSD